MLVNGKLETNDIIIQFFEMLLARILRSMYA